MANRVYSISSINVCDHHLRGVLHLRQGASYRRNDGFHLTDASTMDGSAVVTDGSVVAAGAWSVGAWSVGA